MGVDGSGCWVKLKLKLKLGIGREKVTMARTRGGSTAKTYQIYMRLTWNLLSLAISLHTYIILLCIYLTAI